jgi:hypothetical protein
LRGYAGMKYNSIGEYFYRLSNRCLALILLPVVVILTGYLTNQYFALGLPLSDPVLGVWEILALEISGMLVLTILFVWISVRKLRQLKSEPSLGKRMSGYVSIVMTRAWSFSAMLLAIGITLFFTGNLIFLYPLPCVGLLFLIFWPSPTRMAADLKLKSEERDIIKNKKLGV